MSALFFAVPAAETRMTHQAIYEHARRLIQEGHPAQAVDLVQDWLASNPGDEIGMSMLGSALMRIGRLQEACTVLGKATRLHPESFAAFGDLGFALITAGERAAAITAFARSVELNPGFYQGWSYLARLQFEENQLDEAAASYARAEATDPFAAAAREIRDQLNNSRLAAAEKRARDVLSRQPGHPKASFALAHLASSVGAFEEAAGILSLAISNFPCDVNLRAALVNSLEETGDYERALSEAGKAAELDSANPARWLTIGRLHASAGRYEKALSAYDRALTLTSAGDDPARGNLELLRGHILKILGRHAEAVGAYRTSAASVGGNGAAWWGLADMKTHQFTDDDLEEMRRIAANGSSRPAHRSQAAFALGKALEDRGRYEEAFRCYEQANVIRPGVEFSVDGLTDSVRKIIETFDAGLLAHQADPGPGGPTPIFIVGLPRSGSTLVEQILASHSEIDGTMELVNLPNLLRRIRIDGGKRGKDWPQSMGSFSASELSAYGQRYLDETAIYRSGGRCFIDKMPTNFDKVGLIHMILPSAVIIDARRHPLDCGFSCFKQHFAGGHDFSYRLENIGAYYNAYLSVMDHWDAVLPGKVFHVQYEELVAHTARVVRSLLEHCGIAFEEQCLDFFENVRPVRTPSSEQVRQPIYTKGIGHWRRFEPYLHPLVRSLGPATLDRFDAQIGRIP